MTDIACATSSSLASITGAVAAIAEPPQIDEPTPMSVEIFVGIFSALHMMNAISSEAVIVLRIIGSDCTPVRPMTARFMPKPSRITAHWSIFLDVNLMPASNGARFFRSSPTVIPSRMEITGPPTMANFRPSSHAGIAITRHKSNPLSFSFMG